MQHISDNQPACFLTLRQASRKSSRSPDTVARWCASLDIGFRDERGRWHVHAGKLAAVITARQVLGLDEPAEADRAQSDIGPGMRRASRFLDRIAFRCPGAMATAIQQAADRERISPSDYARRAVARQLQADGFVIADNTTEAL
jgi:hypothetical protein